MIRKFFKNFLNFDQTSYPIIEGKFADSYTDDETIKMIQERYKEQWIKDVTPYTHPQLFDPFNPPNSWRYDPYYEVWIKINE